ncbi:MAG: hypothetical protein MRY74_17360 [Neomegalonema sp.]|nr:hypothetical protein [Neomegalonema sp.]
MFTMGGAIVGFIAMLAARGRAGIAAGLAVLGLVLGVMSSIVFAFEVVSRGAETPEKLMNIDWSVSSWIALACAALPGVAGALFARRD